MRSSMSDITSLTSATAEFTHFGSIICIRGSKSDKNVVPSPKTTQGSSSDSRIRPVPAFAVSTARSTGTEYCNLDTCNKTEVGATYYYSSSGRKIQPISSSYLQLQSRMIHVDAFHDTPLG